MNLSKLFEMQRKLDEKILERFPHLRNEDLLPKKILALQVELGELCNCWRGFKFWSEDQEPRNFAKCWNCSGQGKGYFSGHKWSGDKEICIECSGTGVDKTKNPLLEEYVDCLHFILSIGLEVGANDFLQKKSDWTYMAEKDIVSLFKTLFTIRWNEADDYGHHEYFDGFEYFMTLGRELGFTFEQIEQAYMEKNAENHRRQEVGY